MGKLYYSSSEVSTMLDLEPSVLRFWEDQFSLLRIKRSRAGKRMYREKDIELIRTIKQLTRDEGYTIAGARKKLQESSSDRAAVKAGSTAEKADRATGRTDRVAGQTDRAAGQTERTAGHTEHTAGQTGRTAEKDAPPESASESEIIQWIRSRLTEMREMMD